jgi:hypothetical protein
MNSLGTCTCASNAALCDQCRHAAINVAIAASATCDSSKGRAVNEIEHEDPQSGRVFTVRRANDGQWYVTDVRRMGSIERGRCRPMPSDA